MTKSNEVFEADYDFAKSKSAQIFKTIVDPFIGKYSLIKVCSGVIKNDDSPLQCDQRRQRRNSANCMCLREAAPLRFRSFMQAISELSANSDATDGRYPFFQEQPDPVRQTGSSDSVYIQTLLRKEQGR